MSKMKFHHSPKEVEIQHNGRKKHKSYKEESIWANIMEIKTNMVLPCCIIPSEAHKGTFMSNGACI